MFSPVEYKKKNYAHLRADDHYILKQVRDFFAAAGVSGGEGIDAGSGANLYPTMAMLPFCDKITLLDISASNVNWLDSQIRNPDKSWEEFWTAFQEVPKYRELGSLRDQIRDRVRADKGSLFNLDQGKYDIGTMFFVAESLTDDPREFRDAVKRFVGSLKNDAPFAIAFMSGSLGYQVDKEDFPAVAIDRIDVQQCLEAVAKSVNVVDVGLDEPFREGYEGMLLATGRATSV